MVSATDYECCRLSVIVLYASLSARDAFVTLFKYIINYNTYHLRCDEI